MQSTSLRIFSARLFVLLVGVIGCIDASIGQSLTLAERERIRLSHRINGELILMLKGTTSPDSLIQKWKRYKEQPTQLQPIRNLSDRMNIHLFSYDTMTVKGELLLESLRKAPSVKLAQFNHDVELRSDTSLPNDPSFNAQWGMHNTGQTGGTVDADIDGPEAWDCVTGGLTRQGDTIVIAVIDGGADLNHSDINFWKNEDEIPGNNVDDDNNGYVDDYEGWDAYNSDGTVPSDDHGTHVSGIAGAIGNNGTGVTGVNWTVQIMPIAGSSTSEAIVVAAYDYVLTQRLNYNRTNGDSGAFVVGTNSSFGVDFANPDDYPIWCSMYDSMGEAGILSAASTMNRDEDVDEVGDVPTACPSDHLITVTNTTDTDQKSSFAAWGDTTIDLGAPGTNIYSTEAGNTYGYKSGTSMASPHVAGAIGFMFAAQTPEFINSYHARPEELALDVKEQIIDHVDTINDLENRTVSKGRLNIHNPLREASNVNADLSYEQTGLTFTFRQATANARSFQWKLGDQTTAWGDSVVHTFNDTGNYQVCLMASNRCHSDTICRKIRADCPTPEASFNCYADRLTVYCVDSSQHHRQQVWKFGGGDTAHNKTPSHTYPDTGTYRICLTVGNDCYTDTSCQLVTVSGQSRKFGKIGVRPNPFRQQTTIQYQLVAPSEVRFSLHDMLGRLIKEIDRGQEGRGIHSLRLRAGDLDPGVYYYQLRAGQNLRGGRIILIR